VTEPPQKCGFTSQDHIRRFSTKREYTSTIHISIQYHMKFLLQIKCHVLEFTEGEAIKDASKDN
jgi:hypothetical protein